jgi:hypothetical protein
MATHSGSHSTRRFQSILILVGFLTHSAVSMNFSRSMRDLKLACWERNNVLGGAQRYRVWRKVNRSSSSPLVIAVLMYFCRQPVQQETHQGCHVDPKPLRINEMDRNLLIQSCPVPAAKPSKHTLGSSRCMTLGQAIERVVLTQGPYILIHCDTFQDGTSHRSCYKANRAFRNRVAVAESVSS